MNRLLKAFVPPAVPAAIVFLICVYGLSRSTPDVYTHATNNPAVGVAIFTTVGFLGGCLYFLPAIVAGLRDAPHYLGILTLNTLGTPLILGWPAALIWAFVDERRQPVIIQQNFYQPPAKE